MQTKQKNGAESLPHLPIAALRASSEVGFCQGVLQSEFLHNLGQDRTFIAHFGAGVVRCI